MIIFNETTFDELVLPDRLYKYRFWTKPFHTRVLTNNEIYFAPPFDLDELCDHHECNLERDFDLVNEGLFYNYFSEKLPNLSEQDRRELARERMQNSPIFNQDHQQEVQRDFRNCLNDCLSIFCASEHRDNQNLWNIFADEQRGFCVGLNTRRMFDSQEIFGSGGRMTYFPDANPPKIRPICTNNADRVADMMQVIFSLPDIYEPEDEYRLTKVHLGNRQVQIPIDAFEEIILGPEIADAHKEEITEIKRQRFPNARLIQTSYHAGLYTFTDI